jgi:hypothetical protein
MAFEIPLELIAFLAIFLGTIGRTVFPFLKKLDPNDQTPITFNVRFWMTAIISGIFSAIFIYPIFVMPGDSTLFEIFIAGFITAWGSDDILNRLVHNGSTTTNGTTDTATTTLTVDSSSPVSELKFKPE